MKNEVKTPVLIGIVVVLVGGIVVLGFKFLDGVGNLDHGQISYTPGVPPWMEKDPAKRAQFSAMPGELHTYNPNQAGQAPPSSAPVGK